MMRVAGNDRLPPNHPACRVEAYTHPLGQETTTMATKAGKQEAAPFRGFLERSIKAMGKRAGAGDLDSLVEMRELHRALGDQIAAAARMAHGDVPGMGPAVPFSWAEIGAVLGISRQGARQTFGLPLAPVAHQHTPSQVTGTGDGQAYCIGCGEGELAAHDVSCWNRADAVEAIEMARADVA